MTLNEFEKLVNDHDLTYTYSDDGYMYRRGDAQRSAIKAAAKTLPTEDVVRIWDAMVEKRLAPGFREGFYWK